MTRRSVRLLTVAALAATASLVSVSAASADCLFGCGPYYALPVTYAPCGGCAAAVPYAAPIYEAPVYQAPMYVVNQGPAFNAPVIGEADPFLDTGYRHFPYIGYRYWHRHYGWGYRHHVHRNAMRYGMWRAPRFAPYRARHQMRMMPEPGVVQPQGR